MKEQKNIIPLNSHLVRFDKPKTILTGGYVCKTYGMLISSIWDPEYKHHRTLRTILKGELMEPFSHLDSENADFIYEYENFPVLTKKDILMSINYTQGERGVSETLYDLEKLGFHYEKEGEEIVAEITKSNNGWNVHNWDLFDITLKGQWIPSALEELCEIQSFLKCPITLVAGKDEPIDEKDLELMNRILDNNFKYGIYIDSFDPFNLYYNDGVYTYSKDGKEELMSRAEFLERFPDAYKI